VIWDFREVSGKKSLLSESVELTLMLPCRARDCPCNRNWAVI